jgi:hypothetical protein
VGVVIGGHKQIWVNAFKVSFLRLIALDKPFSIDDGGCGFWRVYRDVATGKLSGFDCNGVA